MFTKPLPRNGPGISPHITVVAYQWLYTLHCPILKAIHPEWPTGVSPFLLFQGLCLGSPSSLWLSFHSVYSPTAPSLRPLVLSGSLISCELVQVHHNQPRSSILLDPIYIIYLGQYLVQALP
jgi:hypothetical protein